MAARVFMSYSHKDEELRDELELRLAMLKRQGLIEVWHDRRMLSGDRLDWTISQEMDAADIIILLVSPDFIASDYCYKIEKARALQRHNEGTARLISVILRPCDWTHTELADFLVTPKDGKPITQWPDRDEAFLDVAKSIRRAINEVGLAGSPKDVHDYIDERTPVQVAAPLPRSSNLRLRREFTAADRDRFLLEAFDFSNLFFQGSLQELEARNNNIETRYRRIDENCFTSAIYRNGDKVAACTIRTGGNSEGITFAHGDVADSGSFNELLSIQNDDQKLFLRPLGMPQMGGTDGNSVLSNEGAAEYLWSLLIMPLQGDW